MPTSEKNNNPSSFRKQEIWESESYEFLKYEAKCLRIMSVTITDVAARCRSNGIEGGEFQDLLNDAILVWKSMEGDFMRGFELWKSLTLDVNSKSQPAQCLEIQNSVIDQVATILTWVGKVLAAYAKHATSKDVNDVVSRCSLEINDLNKEMKEEQNKKDGVTSEYVEVLDELIAQSTLENKLAGIEKNPISRGHVNDAVSRWSVEINDLNKEMKENQNKKDGVTSEHVEVLEELIAQSTQENKPAGSQGKHLSISQKNTNAAIAKAQAKHSKRDQEKNKSAGIENKRNIGENQVQKNTGEDNSQKGKGQDDAEIYKLKIDLLGQKDHTRNLIDERDNYRGKGKEGKFSQYDLRIKQSEEKEDLLKEALNKAIASKSNEATSEGFENRDRSCSSFDDDVVNALGSNDVLSFNDQDAVKKAEEISEFDNETEDMEILKDRSGDNSGSGSGGGSDGNHDAFNENDSVDGNESSPAVAVNIFGVQLHDDYCPE